jgi:hypothetical protein
MSFNPVARPSGARRPSPVPLDPRSSVREQRRADVVDRLLDSLEDLVHRHRGLATAGSHRDLHAELVAAEVAHVLAVARSNLLRHRPLRVVTPSRPPSS